MPPEPLPWDRKDLAFKDRKHERITAGDGGGGGNYTSRWRASPRRPPLSYYRQNGSCYDAYSPSRSDEGFRSSYGRCNGIRISSRENRRRSPYYDSYSPSHGISQRSAGESCNDHRLDQARDQDRDHLLGTIAWKPLKWTRQSLVRSEEAGNGELEVSVVNLGVVEKSPKLTVDSEEGVARKKTMRLSWGQGLAMYEKQKVEGSVNSESSLKAAGAPGSMSPATPCSAATCSAPGIEDRPFSKAKDIDKATIHHSEVSDLVPPTCLELPNNLDQLPSISMLIALLNDLLQPEDACTGDSTFTRYTATTKLLSFKADVSKELEKTECEIDLLENELRSLNNGIRCNSSQISFSLQNESSSMSCPKSVYASSMVSSDITPIVSSAVPVVRQSDLPICSPGKHESEVKHANSDIPKTDSSSNGGLSSSGNEDQLSLVLGERAVAGNGSGDLNHSDGGRSGNSNFIMRSRGNKDNNLIDLIISSNREASRWASHAFDKALPTATQQFDIWESDRISLCRKNDMHIREKLALRKHQIKFKERVLVLKFRAFNHLWKEDLRLLSARKQRTKSQKHFEICGHSSQSSMQNHRSSVRSRFTLPAGNLTLVPTADIVDFTSKLLSEPQIKLYRDNLKMPALVLDEKERGTRFFNKHNLIEDPVSFEKERLTINPWTREEREAFMEKLGTFGKDFAKISSLLSHKTTADCVEFYYKNHKSESFRDVKKQLDLRKQWRCPPANTYMVTSGKRWNRDTNAASLDMSGGSRRNQPKYSARSIARSCHGSKVSRGSCSSSEIGKETAGADVLTGEAVSSSVTSSISPSERMNFVREAIEEEDTCSDEASGDLESVDWTGEEKFLFIQALGTYAKDFARISRCVGTKSREQCKTFFSKARKCLGLDQILQGAGNANEGSSDPDGACAAETDSMICSTQSCSRMDVDFTHANAGGEAEGNNWDEIHDKVDDGLRSALNAEKLETEGEDLQSKCEPVPSVVGRELGEGESLVPVSSIVPSIASCTEVEHPLGSNNAEQDDSYAARKMNNACPNNHILNFTTHQQHPAPLELLSFTGKKSQMPSSKRNNAYSVPSSTALPDPSSICSEAFLNLDEHLHKLYQGSASSRVLSGYPLQFPNRKGLKNPISCENHSNGSSSSHLNGYTVPCKAGDVKLFGQILTKSPSPGTDGQPLSPKQKKTSTRNGNFAQSGLEDVPLQSYGYWDGKRIRTGFSTLPPESSAIMLAAYQGSVVTGKPFFSTTKDIGASSTNRAVTSNYHRANGKSNGFELVSGFQQKGRTAMARLGVNMAVSDPVAALKMAKLWKQDSNGT